MRAREHRPRPGIRSVDATTSDDVTTGSQRLPAAAPGSAAGGARSPEVRGDPAIPDCGTGCTTRARKPKVRRKPFVL